MRLVLPLPPNAANSRRSWRVALRDKKAYWGQCSLLLSARRVPLPPPVRPERVRLTAVLYLHNFMDDDNAMARLKPVLDWLKGWGYIADDRRKNIEWSGLPEQHIDRQNPRCEIVVEPAEAP